MAKVQYGIPAGATAQGLTNPQIAQLMLQMQMQRGQDPSQTPGYDSLGDYGQQPNHPVYSVGQGLADVAGQLGSAYFRKKRDQQLMQGMAENNANLNMAAGLARDTSLTPQSADIASGTPRMAQPAFPNGAPQVPGAGGPPSGPMPQAQSAFPQGYSDPMNATQRGNYALDRLSAANPNGSLALQYGDKIREAANAAQPHINWQNTGSQMTPMDDAGNVMGNVKPIAMGMSPFQSAQVANEQATAAETKREHDITAKQNRIRFEKDAMGNIVPFDTQTQKFVDPKDVGLPENMNAESAQQTGQMIYEYRKKPLAGFVAKTPWGIAVQDEVNKLDAQGQQTGGQPWNEQYYTTSQKARNDFATGQLGNTVRSMNVWTHHLGMLQDLGAALDNGDSQTVSKITNLFKNEFNSPTLAGYDAIAPLVGEEGAKAIMGNKGTGAEREGFIAPLTSARNSASRNAAIGTMMGAATQQLRGLQNQYEQSVRAKDFDKLLLPDVRDRLASGAAGAPGTGGGAAPAPAAKVDYKSKYGLQ